MRPCRNGPDISLTAIALAGALPVILFSPRRTEIFKTIDWHTLIFFAAMFVTMQSVWDSGLFQALLPPVSASYLEIPSVIGLGILVSQITSNVPFVALFLPFLIDAGAPIETYLALSAGSTIAGNLLIIGAASNVIIIQTAEKQEHSIRFAEFAKIGIPLTIGQAAIYIISFGLLP